jgi:hypothetical protein
VIPLVDLTGGPAELGLQHGRARRADLRAFLDDGLTRLDQLLPHPVPLARLRPLIERYRDEIAPAVPQLAEEVAGLARGAGISETEAWLLQLRRELLGYQKVPTAGDCTTYARAGSEEAVLAQTVDLVGNLDDVIAVLRISPAEGHRMLVLSFGGLLGYLGVNSAGLAVGINLVLGGDWQPGVPPYLAVRHVLQRAANAVEALAVLRELNLAGSRSISLCDARGTAWVEFLDGEAGVHQGPQHVHANHFLHAAFQDRDELNVFARNSSLRRHRACSEALAALAPDCSPEQHFELLSRPPILVPDHGEIRRERTVAAAVLLPGRGELHVRRGDPSRSTTTVFRLP